MQTKALELLPRSFVQMMPGVLVVLASGDERFLRSENAPEPSPVAAPSSSQPQTIPELLTTADIGSVLTVPQGLQIILLPATTVLAGLPASSPILASFNVPAALSGYNYILTTSGTQLPALPAGLSSVTPTPGAISSPALILVSPSSERKLVLLGRQVTGQSVTPTNACLPCLQHV